MIEGGDIFLRIHKYIAGNKDHERFDGSGYPHALKGEKICREARILAVADTIEAMTGARP